MLATLESVLMNSQNEDRSFVTLVVWFMTHILEAVVLTCLLYMKVSALNFNYP